MPDLFPGRDGTGDAAELLGREVLGSASTSMTS